MRTTVTLEPDLAAALKEQARERGISFKSALNGALRAGLGSSRSRQQSYQERPRHLGVRSDIDVTKALQLAGALEDEEIARKIMLRK